MNKNLSLLFCSAFLFFGFTYLDGESMVNSEPITYEKSLKMLKDCYPDGYYILQQDDKETIEFWLSAMAIFEDGGISSINTAVHETVHHYDFEKSDSKHSTYFITKEIEISVKNDAIFKSSEIVNLIPEGIKDKRFGDYIKGDGSNSIMSSISNGIYGIFEEYSAYYHGNQASVNLMVNNYGAPDYRSISDVMESYYEFNLFMACYLMYAKDNYPEKYTATVENKNLIVCYTLIEKRFSTLIETIQKNDRLSKRYSLDFEIYYTQKFKDAISVLYNAAINEMNYKNYLDAENK